MVAPSRQIAYQLLCRIETRRSFSDYVLNSRAMSRLAPRDRNLVTEIVLGTLRWQGYLDFLLSAASHRPWSQVDATLKVVLRMSLYQLWNLDKVPDHALVHDAVEICKLHCRPGSDKFVNAVLRWLSGNQPWRNHRLNKNCPEWDQVSLPRWLWERWARRFGGETAREYALSLNRPPTLALRVAPGESGLFDTTFASTGGFRYSDLVPGAWIMERQKEALRVVREHDGISIHDEASQLIPFLFSDLEGKSVWDVCAAPGGKSLVLRELCGSKGWIAGSDRSFHRAKRLRSLLAKWRGSRSEVVVLDASINPPFRCAFDAALVDAPCSGLGTLRRNPEIKWRIRAQDLRDLQERQSGILRAVATVLRPGGQLLYSTCSTEPEENEEVITRFLKDNQGFRLLRPSSPSHISSWIGDDEMVRTYPSTYPWDGFFAVLLQRGCDQ